MVPFHHSLPPFHPRYREAATRNAPLSICQALRSSLVDAKEVRDALQQFRTYAARLKGKGVRKYFSHAH